METGLTWIVHERMSEASSLGPPASSRRWPLALCRTARKKACSRGRVEVKGHHSPAEDKPMTQDTMRPIGPVAPSLSPLLRELGPLLAAHRPAVGQARCFARLCALVVGFLRRVSRPTLAGVLLTLGLYDADWSAFYRVFSQERLH